MNIDNVKVTSWDKRRNLLIPGDQNAALDVCLRHFISIAKSAIEEKGAFTVALAGGSTPKALYERLASLPYSEEIDWSKVWLFWGDERSVSPDDPESNYRMAMESGFGNLPIPKDQIFRMEGEKDLEESARRYEEQIKQALKSNPFDLVILGMGDDGHTASLFPQTEGLKAEGRLAIANYVPQKNTWRLTLTFAAINSAKNIAIYVMGAGKKHMVAEVLKSEDQFERYPIQRVGTKENPALWIIDEAASAELE
ncbi:MAG: 6-phosphogluconolactonase [Chlamydiae bacterium]|nr:6-phosphogluconolactonase [Chlamydiota bacterium]